jgi:thiol-disulfide isomerase/thioredoxin
MKRFFGFLVLLCAFFGAFGQGLGVGDRLPAGVLGGYRGKVLVLDFWATWCAPCRAMVPVLDSLQKEFGDKVVFLPVAYEGAAVVGPVLAAMKRARDFELPGVVGDTVLGRLFPHRALPHFVWIGGDGVVAGITEEWAVTGENVRRVLAGGRPLGARKADVLGRAYDAGRPLFFNGEAFRYHSLLTGYVPGLPGGLSVSAFDPALGQHFSVRNAPLVWLARLAFGRGAGVFLGGGCCWSRGIRCCWIRGCRGRRTGTGWPRAGAIVTNCGCRRRWPLRLMLFCGRICGGFSRPMRARWKGGCCLVWLWCG